jgi:hypothetical protein
MNKDLLNTPGYRIKGGKLESIFWVGIILGDGVFSEL